MKITISGTPGSGKSTVGKALAKEFNLKHFSTGDFMRDLAKKRGMSLMDLSALAETDRSIDEEIDEYSSNLGKTQDDFVIDSRLAFHFIPDSFKILIRCTAEEGARRIFGDIQANVRGVEGEIKTLEQATLAVKSRMESERKRYNQYYGIDVDNSANFDVIIDTTDLTKEEAIKQAIDAVKKHLKKE